MEKIEEFAKVLFEAYRERAKGLAYDKTEIPKWVMIGTEVRDNWIYTATVGLIYIVNDIGEKLEIQR